jgi:hypothetical protein
LLRSVSEPIVKGVLGALVAGFAVSALRSRGSYELTDDRLAWLFGVSAGVLGGAYGMNGPPLVVYGALRRWPPEHFRPTLPRVALRRRAGRPAHVDPGHLARLRRICPRLHRHRRHDA